MSLRIWHISKANARIEELETQLASVAKERDEARTALESNSSEVTAGAEQLQRDLDTAKQTIGTLTTHNATAAASLAAKDIEIAALTAKFAGQSEQVKIQVSQQTASTLAQLGQPPMAAAPAEAKATAKKGMDRVYAAAERDLAAGGFKPS